MSRRKDRQICVRLAEQIERPDSIGPVATYHISWTGNLSEWAQGVIDHEDLTGRVIRSLLRRSLHYVGKFEGFPAQPEED